MVSQRNLPFDPIRPKMMFESVSEHFVNLSSVKWCKTCVFGMNSLFRGTELAKIVSQRNQPFYLIGPQTMFQCVSEHFANPSGVKPCKTCVFGLNSLFRVTELAKMVSQGNQPFYLIGLQMMFESVSEHFVNLQDAKRGKTCVSGLNVLFWGTEVAKMFLERNQPFHIIRPQTMF